MLDVPLSVKIEEYRRKVLEKTITTEELREIVRLIREGRMMASQAKERKAKATPSGDDLLDEMEKL